MVMGGYNAIFCHCDACIVVSIEGMGFKSTYRYLCVQSTGTQDEESDGSCVTVLKHAFGSKTNE